MFAVLVNIGGKIKLFGIPAMEHGSAEAQFDALVALLQLSILAGCVVQMLGLKKTAKNST